MSQLTTHSYILVLRWNLDSSRTASLLLWPLGEVMAAAESLARPHRNNTGAGQVNYSSQIYCAAYN